MKFNWLDYTLLGLIGCSILISLARGFVRELCSLMNWMLAAWLGFCWYKPIAAKLPESIHSPSLRWVLGFAVVFVLSLLVGTLLSWLLAQLVTKTGLGGTDRLLGLIFGGLRGILIVTLLIILGRLTPLPEEGWWKTSRLIPYFQPLEHWLQRVLPDTLAEYLQAAKLRFDSIE